MHLIYIDESGNTGRNLSDLDQPVFVLGALVVPETFWQRIESDLEEAIKLYGPKIANLDFEVHAGDIRQGTGVFRGLTVADRLTLRDAWLEVAVKYKLHFIYRAIVKKRYEHWMISAFGTGVSVNPHLAAFPLVAQVANNLLRSLGDGILGIFISDDNREVVGDIERFQKLLRVTPGTLHLDRIIEKGFFIDSRKSRLLQLADLCTLHARKLEERKIGQPAKSIDDRGIELIEPLIHRGREQLPDVIQWLQQVQK
ncbi:MAG: DUF3800 domain-containing protein [Verrucomicrobiaceae bacterium]|nr:DUF3800 domain-containing protein [Verrucomicrobiaceae bacterium]